MIEHSRYRYSKAVNRYDFFLDSNFIEEDVIFINKNNITAVIFNEYYNYSSNNINVLEFIKDVEFVEIVSEVVTDLSALKYLKKLKWLYVSNLTVDIKIDISQNIKLEYLNIPTTNIRALENCKSLNTLILRRCKFDEIDYNVLPNLRSLSFLDSKKISNLNFLPDNLQIVELDLSHLPNLIDISFISNLAKKLKILEIENCKKISNIEIISTLKSLEKLMLCNSVPLASTSIIQPLIKLEYFTLQGSSFFIDGNLKLLTEINIKYVGINNKKHYTNYPKSVSIV